MADDSTIPDPNPLTFLAGGGEMGPRIREFDWAATLLGPIDGWPQSLRSTLSICLNSNFPIAIYWGSDLVLLYNDEWSPIPGEKHPWALGRPAREAWPEIWHIIEPLFRRVMRTGQATRSRDQLLPMHRHGFTEECYFDYTFSPIRGDGGGVAGVFNAVLETTTRVIGERRLGLLRELGAWKTGEARTAQEACETATHIIAQNPHDLPFTLLYLVDETNRATLAGLSGLKRGTAASPDVIELDAADAPWPLRQAAEQRHAIEIHKLSEKIGLLPGGAWPEPTERAMVLPLTKSGQSQLTGFLVAGISPRLALNDAYRGFLELLGAHISAAVASAQAYEEERRRAEALAELDRAKTAFFSNVSHEFRTPLALMLGPIEDMLAEPGDPMQADSRQLLEVVHRNGLRLQRLVNTLLDFSRIEAGRGKACYEPTDLASFTADLASNFRSACERAGLQLQVDCTQLDEPVYVDRQMYEKIVLNLLSNAFKFTFKGSIAVTLRLVEQSETNRSAELRIQDTGTGIPADEIPRLFERFHRIENARGRTHEGSGIGLALVHELVKLHGGTIHAESEIDRGTAFIVTLPLGSSHLSREQIGSDPTALTSAIPIGATAFVDEALRWLPDTASVAAAVDPELPADPIQLSSHPARSRRSGQRPRLLVADDNADLRAYVARLTSAEYTVEAVTDGWEALQSIQRQLPDLVLSDVMMPRVDGFELLRQIRSNPATSGLPVILLSARAGEESRVEGIEAGADDYLVKPFNARELLTRVRALLEITRMRRESEMAMRSRSEQLRRLADVATRLNAALDLKSITGVVTEEARSLIGTHQAVTGFTIDQNWGQAINSVSLSDKYAPWRDYDTKPDGSGIYALVCQTNRPLRLTQAELEEHPAYQRFGSHAPQHPPMRGWLAAPLVGRDGHNIGLVQLSDKFEGDFTEEDEAILVQLAQMASVAIENAHLVNDLREGDRRKDEFLATLAHELRNPLAPIRNGLQIMRLAKNDADAVEHVRTMMERQLGYLVHLVDDLLDLSRISRGKIELRKQRIELAKILQQAVETSRPLIDGSNHTLTVDLPADPVFVNADVTRLAQVFSNLLNNAAKYTEPGGAIRLSARPDENFVFVAVKDSGVGIPANMLPRIFDAFTQVDQNLERSQGGLGIGLSIVKRLVGMHDGHVVAKSDGFGMGSEFTVQLPVLLSVFQQLPDETKSTEPFGRRRVLVVDDNRDAAMSLAMMLNLMGNDSQTAHDGVEAIDVAAAFRPNLILLDIGMPRLNGYETARRIRAQPWGETMMIVALTGWGQEEDRRQAQESGFDAHMVKPIEPEAVEKLLAQLQSITT